MIDVGRVPNADYCVRCGDRLIQHAADSWYESDDPAYIIALYSCGRGHTWSTIWGKATMCDAVAVSDQIKANKIVAPRPLV